MSHTFGIQVTLKAIQGKGDDLARIMLEAAAIIENLPGCQSFIVMRAMADPDQVMITEIWDNQQTHQASLANQDVLNLINSTRCLITHMSHHAGRPINQSHADLRTICAGTGVVGCVSQLGRHRPP